MEARKVDAEFKAEIRKYLEKYRLAGLDIEIIEPQYVPLYIRMNVCVAPNHFRDNVKRELMDVFSNRDLPDGHVGFFHPDNFTFGQPVYLSKIYESAMKVQGISSVSITGPENFRRLTRSPEGELYDGAIRMEISEIARVDNDLNFPDNGKFEFNMEGGQ